MDRKIREELGIINTILMWKLIKLASAGAVVNEAQIDWSTSKLGY